MPYYAESPLERITDVHWKKKRPDPPPTHQDPCGALVISPNPADGISRWFPESFQPFSIGLANTRGAYDGVSDPLDASKYLPYNVFRPPQSFGDQYGLYYCGYGQRGYTVTLRGGAARYLGIDVYYGISPQNIKVDDVPNDIYEDFGFVTAEIQGISPIVSLWGWTRDLFTGIPRDHWGRHNELSYRAEGIVMTFQVHCGGDEYKDVPPPQPPGNGWSGGMRRPPPPWDGQSTEPPV